MPWTAGSLTGRTVLARGVVQIARGNSVERLMLQFADWKTETDGERAKLGTTNPIIGDSYGLGLNIVVRLLDQVGGRLEVMSRPDQGTTFWIYFPLRLPPGAATPQVDGQEPITRVLERVVTIRQVANENG